MIGESGIGVCINAVWIYSIISADGIANRYWSSAGILMNTRLKQTSGSRQQWFTVWVRHAFIRRYYHRAMTVIVWHHHHLSDSDQP